MKYGPDGQVYFIDWYDRQQCHHNGVNVHDRTNGRIFKLSHGGAKADRVDLGKMTTLRLSYLLLDENEWNAAHAARIFRERGPSAATAARLFGLASAPIDPAAMIRILCVATAIEPFDDDRFAATLGESTDPDYRSWTIRLAVEQEGDRPKTFAGFRDLAASDPSPVVRLALASALQRMPLDRRWPIIEALLAHGEDSDDHNLPLMYWYAFEPLAAADPARALGIAAKAKVAKVFGFTVRRVAAIGTPGAMASLVETLGRTEGSEPRRVILAGINEALKGRRSVERTPGWPEVFAGLLKDASPEVRSQATALALTFGDASALSAFRSLLADPRADLGLRRGALTALLKAGDAGSVPTLQALVAEPSMRGPAIRGLASFADTGTPKVLLGAYPGLAPIDRRDALDTLASRPAYALALLDAVGRKEIPRSDLSAALIRQIGNLKDPSLDARVAEVWGSARETPADRARQIAAMKTTLTSKPEKAPDLSLGRSVFAKTCQQCHVLFGTGGNIGPELTGSNRADLDYVLANVYDPSALIGKDYQAHVIVTKDGRVLTGTIRAEDKDAITLATTGETIIVPKADIEERAISANSMMPERLWETLADPEIRSLVAHLAGPAQVPMLATAENARGFFNGRDLAGWAGDPSLWTVEDGEIVGRTKGLGRNEFLRSDLAAGDFRLTLQVKLVANAGNSGIQFRSEARPDGEVKGYQADVGPGWWGKLYEENGRGMLSDHPGESFVKPGEWNRYEIVAVGSKLRTAINGHPCATLDDPSGARRGIVAFQLHSGGPTEVRFKDLVLEIEPPAAP